MNDKLADAVWTRADGRCEYCRLPDGLLPFLHEVDHIVAKKHEGSTRLGNLALACEHCNGCKGPNLSGIDPSTGRLTRLFHPRRHKWSHHFKWDAGFLRGRTPIGRATINVLKINSPKRVELRLGLHAEGVFVF